MVTRKRVKQERATGKKEEGEVVEKKRPTLVIAKTPNQRDYINTMDEKDIIICTGPSGTGKTFIASGVACEKLYERKIKQILVTRPLVSTGRDIGALPGDVSSKIQPYLIPLEENLKKFLKFNYDKALEQECIKYEVLELMRGRTFDNTFMILDEAQNCTKEQIKMFITRIGKNSTVVINGDTKQTDLYDTGLGKTIKILNKVLSVGFIEFDKSDIQRNKVIEDVLLAYEKDEEEENAR